MSNERPLAEQQPSTAVPTRLVQIPTQRGLEPVIAPDRASAPDRAPVPAPEPAPLPAQPAAPVSRRGQLLTLGVSAAVVASLLVTTGVVQHQRTVRAEQRAAADLRVAAAMAAHQADAPLPDAPQLAGEGAWIAALTQAHTAAAAAASSGTQGLAAAPHAGAGPIAALTAATDAASAAAVDPTVSLVTLRTATAGVAGPVKAAQEAEAAWQAAEQARIAAEQAAAKAAAAAAARGTKSPARRTTTSRSTSGSKSSSGIPSGGLVCPGAPVGSGGSESSVSAIGSAINAYRQSKGLSTLGVQRSSYLVGHAKDMANRGGIWHSGSDNIVGCTSGSVQSLINAWAASPSHNKQMLRTDVSVMRIGGATAGGWLYGAVDFA